MRKLRTFYWKVTEFLNDDKIMRLQRLAAFAINGVYCRAEQYGYLYRFVVCLCVYVARKLQYRHMVTAVSRRLTYDKP